VIAVLRAGRGATVQDLGRPGFAHLGIGRSGAADRGSLRLANRLVGNTEGAAGLEVTLGGLAVRFDAAATVALAGAPCPVRLGGRGAALHAPLAARTGDVLELGAPPRGVRTYLAVRGGIAVAPVLGSRSTDVLGGIGPEPVRAGDVLPVGRGAPSWPVVDVAPVAPLPDRFALRAAPGPRADWFAPDALDRLRAGPWHVTPAADRIAIRLAGPPLPRTRPGELPPEGMVAGAVQVPPDGRPVVLLVDHPVTGGYPVLAVVAAADLDLAAQCRPGDPVTFRR